MNNPLLPAQSGFAVALSGLGGDGLRSDGMAEFCEQVARVTGNGHLGAVGIDTIQVNVGLRCNQECVHCHVAASPRRREVMDWETMEMVLTAARQAACRMVDITGGAPELHPDFCDFVKALVKQGQSVQVRTNLTVLLEPGMGKMLAFMKECRVGLVASLPCYLEENVDAQRGEGVYKKSIEAIMLLNSIGYGYSDDLPLDLVYNPVGPFLPAGQSRLEDDYRRELQTGLGIRFSRLLTIANMPIGRFMGKLKREGKEQAYVQLLRGAFNPETLGKLMCQHQVSVRWDGTLYDCDFNLALNCRVVSGAPAHIRDFNLASLARRRIVTGQHCFGCTAGAGSSCSGALL